MYTIYILALYVQWLFLICASHWVFTSQLYSEAAKTSLPEIEKKKFLVFGAQYPSRKSDLWLFAAFSFQDVMYLEFYVPTSILFNFNFHAEITDFWQTI